MATLEQRSEGWFEARKGLLTASQFGVMCEVDKYCTARSLWEKRTGRIEVEEDEDGEGENEHTVRGIQYEPTVIAQYEKCLQCKVTAVGLFQRFPFGASPDGLIEGGGEELRRLLEVKCPAWALHAAIPLTYMCQIQGQMELGEEEWCDFCSWHADFGLQVWRVRRSPEFWQWMLPKLLGFQDCLVRDTPPPLRASSPPPPPPECEVLDLGLFKLCG